MPRPLIRPCITKSNTFLNKAGLVNSPLSGMLYGRENSNLFLQSNVFTNAAWTKTRSSMAAGATGPTGAADAFTWSEDNTAGNSHIMLPASSPVVVGRRYTISIEVKKSNRSWIGLQLGNGTNGLFWFDANAGVKGTVSGITSFISLGNGWYRLYLTCPSVVSNTNALFLIGSADATFSFNGLNQASLLVRNAQLKEGDPDEYIGTTAAAVFERY